MADEYLNNENFESTISSFQHFKKQQKKQELVLQDLQESYDRHIRKHPQADPVKTEAYLKAKKQYDEISYSLRECQDALAYSFYILCENLAAYSYTKGLVKDVEEATQDAVIVCLEKIDRFNPNYVGKNGEKSKAFNYMSTCVFNHFKQMCRTSKNFHELKKRYRAFLQHKFDSVFFINGKERSNNSLD